MIKTVFLAAMMAIVSVASPLTANAAVTVGKPAPDFTGTDTNGKEHKLSDFKGKTVVLEWTNPGCPFVVKHYDSGNMQKLQEEYTGKDVVWLTINSGAEGKQGHLTNEEANKYIADHKAKQTAMILDGKGTIGKLYDAKTTPHMFVIDKDGVLVYDGAIDDNDSANKEDAATANNYVKAALDSIAAGKPVEKSKTKPYGCSVKY
ncbi:MAG: thioredoxin family protein [Micavibrio aeruginosavorus]|uniref:Thioredoxin family protein n=1 Tax=Micavibrio aeruginosavorus TaxID=349221 RepID=A0A2W4ZZ62_9BACT|nr:MAG: thioredoxin family protein [Micavibrio aeruginosavorus]